MEDLKEKTVVAENVEETTDISDISGELGSDVPHEENETADVSEDFVIPEKEELVEIKLKKKLPIKKILLCIIVLAAIVAVAVVVSLNNKSNKIQKDILELSGDGKIEKAYTMLKQNKKHKNYEDIKEIIFEDHSEEVYSLLEREKYKESFELLNKISNNPEFETIKSDIYDGQEEKIYELLDKGKYNDGFELLCEITDNPKFDEISGTIIAESWILKGAFDLRQYYKNPSSMQINRVEIYDQEGNTDYPYLVMSTSGQNGFGGYASSYSLFDDDDLTHWGSTNTLDPDSDDDIDDILTAYMIKGVRDNEKLDLPFDLNRVNRILSQNITPDLHIEKHASSKASKA